MQKIKHQNRLKRLSIKRPNKTWWYRQQLPGKKKKCNWQRAKLTYTLQANQSLPLASSQPIIFQPVNWFCAQSAMIKDEWLDLQACWAICSLLSEQAKHDNFQLRSWMLWFETSLIKSIRSPGALPSTCRPHRSRLWFFAATWFGLVWVTTVLSTFTN